MKDSPRFDQIMLVKTIISISKVNVFQPLLDLVLGVYPNIHPLPSKTANKLNRNGGFSIV